MKAQFRVPLSMSLLAVVLFGCATRIWQTNNQENSTVADARISAECGEVDLTDAIQKLSAPAEADQTRKELLSKAKESSACRTQIINSLIQAMNKPQLNFIIDRSSFFLWSNGSMILGGLKAEEALDLLISHLDLHDGSFSVSMSHQPAVLGVEAMGTLAIPKLGTALQHNSNPKIRLAAALCLTEIGGSDSLSLLNNAVDLETDPCVNRFLQISIDILKHEREPNIGKRDEKVIDLRRELLTTFRCQ